MNFSNENTSCDVFVVRWKMFFIRLFSDTHLKTIAEKLINHINVFYECAVSVSLNHRVIVEHVSIVI